jgi:hypothetical protein
MTKVAKILVVIVTFASVAFMGGAIVACWAGPNWQMAAYEASDFNFDQATPESPWTVKTRDRKEESVGQGKILPEAIIVAKKKQAQVQTEELGKLTTEIEAWNKRIKEARALIEVDVAAMDKRQGEYDQEYKELTAANAKLSADRDLQIKEAQQTYETLRLRRQEWLLLKAQLEEIRADIVTTAIEENKLRDALYQAHENLKIADRRKQLLEQDGAKLPDGYDEAAEAPTTEASE